MFVLSLSLYIYIYIYTYTYIYISHRWLSLPFRNKKTLITIISSLNMLQPCRKQRRNTHCDTGAANKVTLCSGQELLIDEDVQGHLWPSHQVLEKTIFMGSGKNCWLVVSMDWFKGKFTGKPPYLMGKLMVSWADTTMNRSSTWKPP